ncbi:NADH-quinone oxidoreductase subunit H [bacterium]|nr:NADH-quinone oxidoreductase subunit H [bacterium]
MEYLFAYVIFPGFLFTAVVGMLVSWIDRKVTARVQWRVGPPLFQPLYDFVKLLGKEIIVPRGASKATFLLAPLFGLAAVTLVSSMIWMASLYPDRGFVGDLIVVIYVMMIPSIAVIIGAFASKNRIASLGASREMKLMLADELPFLLAVMVVIIKSEAVHLGQIYHYQETYGMIFSSWSGVLAMIVAVLCMQAKLTLVPFDIPEAETELMGGVFVEYSGPPLAVLKLTRMMMLFTLPMVMVHLFLGGVHFQGMDILWSILKYVVLLVVIVLIRNTNPRVRIDQAMRFFWGPVLIIGIAAVILALLGF